MTVVVFTFFDGQIIQRVHLPRDVSILKCLSGLLDPIQAVSWETPVGM